MILFPYRAVPSGHQISMVIANILEETAPHRFHGGNRTQTIREWNDALQGRSDLSLDMLYERLEQTCGGGGAKRIEEIKETMAAFRHQKMLRTLRYTMTGSQTYDYQLWDLDPSCPLKIIDQEIFDHAAEHGFPPDFFTKSYFDRVTIYCMPDGADCSSSRFYHCSFSVCGIRGAVFDNADMDDTDFHSALLQMVNFTGATITHSHFRDCCLVSVSFQDARLKSCLTADCEMNRVDFQGAVLDGSSYGRIKARNILNLSGSAITQGGATTEEVRRLRLSVFRELGVSISPARLRPPADRGRRVSALER